MAYGALGPQPHQIGNQAYFKSAGGPTLISRKVYRIAGTVADTVPAKAGWLSARVWGGGGDSDGNAGGGSGGAFARTDMLCTPGQGLSIKVTASTGATTTTDASSVSLAGTVIASAPTGNVSGTSGGVGIGQITAAGGARGQNGVNGGARGGANSTDGGGAGGENNATDLLMAAGPGGPSGQTSTAGGKFPGGGGATPSALGGDGLVIVEFWSGKP